MSHYEIASYIEGFTEHPFDYSFGADLNLWDKNTMEFQRKVCDVDYNNIEKTSLMYEEEGFEVTVNTYNIYFEGFVSRVCDVEEDEVNMLYTVLTALQATMQQIPKTF